MIELRPENLNPLADRLLIERMISEDGTKTEGGLFIPESVKADANQWRVRKVGPDVKTVKVGEAVVLTQYAGQEFAPHWKLVKEAEVVATIDEQRIVTPTK